MKKLLTLAVAVVGAIGCMAQGEILSLNLETGKTYGLKNEALTRMTQNMFGQSIDINMNISTTTLFKVDSADEQGYNMTVWYDNMSVKMSGQAQMEANSDNPTEGDPMSGALSALVGKPFNIKMARNGSIISVTGVEKMLDDMAADLANNFPDMPKAQIEQIQAQFRQSYGEGSIKSNIQTGLTGFPLTPVAVGDSWKNSTQGAGQFPVVINTIYTLTGRTGDAMTIKGDSVITADSSAAPTDMSGMLVRYNINGTQTSETVLAPSTGWTVSGTVVQEISGALVILANEQIPSDMNVPLTSKTTLTLTGFVAE